MPEYMIDENDLTYEQQEYIRAYAIGTADQWESDAVSVTHNLYGSSAPKGIDAFTMPDPFMDGDFDRARYPDNWAGEASFLDKFGVRHFERFIKCPNGNLRILDGHIFQLWDKGKIIAEVDRSHIERR